MLGVRLIAIKRICVSPRPGFPAIGSYRFHARKQPLFPAAIVATITWMGLLYSGAAFLAQNNRLRGKGSPSSFGQGVVAPMAEVNSNQWPKSNPAYFTEARPVSLFVEDSGRIERIAMIAPAVVVLTAVRSTVKWLFAIGNATLTRHLRSILSGVTGAGARIAASPSF